MTNSNLSNKWIRQIAIDEPHKLQRRIEWDGFNSETFEDWLKAGESDHLLFSGSWDADLQDCQAALKENWQLSLLPYDPDSERAFLDLWWPVRLQHENWLRKHVDSSAGMEEEIFGKLADGLLDRLCSSTEAVLWKEFSSGRSPGAMLLAHLGSSGDGSGPPVRELYEEFVREQRRNGLRQILVTYPILGQLIGKVVGLWKHATLEMLERIQADRPVLEQLFGIKHDWPLTSVKLGLSDPHRGGRTVAILGFSDPQTQAMVRVVYKPKDMGVDAAYQALLEDLNHRSDLPPLHTLAIKANDDYGYMEHVEHQLCSDTTSLKDFYFNAGRLTAVLHVLGCTDCHHENLIAHGDQLLLIDTETLLEADLPDHIEEAGSTTAVAGRSNLQSRFQRSVLRSGLLPQWMFMGAARRAVDISALGIEPPASPERQQPGWLGINSDGMIPGRVSKPAQLATSLPVGIGAQNPFHHYLETFCEGFAAQAQSLIALQKPWLETDSVLNRFAGLRRRIVLRATRVYFALQRQQLEPDALRSPQAQALKLEQLARSFLLAESKPLHWPVFAAERRQMRQLDIPFFTHRIDGRALELDHEGSELPDFIQTSGLQAARERLANLNQEEVSFQLSLIRGAVQARQLRGTSSVEGINEKTTKKTQTLTPTQAATRIAELLMAMAIHDPQGQVEWLGMDLGADGESFSFGPVGTTLYGGSIGIACLLSRLNSQNEALPAGPEATAAILKPLRDLVKQPSADGRRRWWRDQPLGLSGCGGILLALQHLGEQSLAEALLADALPRFIEADQQLDVIGGCAGLIGALLRLETPEALELAHRAGEHLLKTQNEAGAWSPNQRQAALLGYSHGTAGYAAALARLHARTGVDAFARAARAAVAYERERFSATQGNWPDLRRATEGSEAETFMVSWCHGAPGIGLGRACLWGTELWDEHCTEEIAVALRTTAAVTALGADHLCCGSLGLMLLLRSLASGPWPVSGELQVLASSAAEAHCHQALERCEASTLELRCFGTQEGSLLLPGFFTGLSGMGLALLPDAGSQDAAIDLLSAGLLHVRSLPGSTSKAC